MTTQKTDLQLGLIGDNIARSRSPLLHRLAGAQNGLAVDYARLVPRDMGRDFDAVFADCARGGYRGINITYPYKERAAARLGIDDPLVRAIGAVNTVLFTPNGPKGFNTDHSGFIAAYRGARGDANPGTVCMVGTGGVGRAIAFGLVALRAPALHLVDQDRSKATALAEALRAAAPGMAVQVFATVAEAAQGAQGLINSTPIGMVGYDGSVFAPADLAGAAWVFDAVYTPVETQFLRDAEAAGLAMISGYELFFWQGVHAWQIFAGLPLDLPALRLALLTEG
ncbi:MAG: shikimate dehydrogenase [Alphaproteobacteria bacterium HGW-Alphaproteobacteria-4]|jgi:shikimate dehydrogenase|nr:MAG: shikimate dehydrogenase [Alphaproteobacteria bacterium HGW-Alphaproteobacteria-4]